LHCAQLVEAAQHNTQASAGGCYKVKLKHTSCADLGQLSFYITFFKQGSQAQCKQIMSCNLTLGRIDELSINFHQNLAASSVHVEVKLNLQENVNNKLQ